MKRCRGFPNPLLLIKKAVHPIFGALLSLFKCHGEKHEVIDFLIKNNFCIKNTTLYERYLLNYSYICNVAVKLWQKSNLYYH